MERVRHVLIGQPRLLGETLAGQQIAQALADGRFARKPADFHVALAHQPAQVEVGQPDGDPQPLRQRALGQRLTLTDGNQDLELTLGLTFHGVTFNI